MTLGHELRERRRVSRRRRQRRFPWKPVLLSLLVVCVFAIGIALGEALHDNPRPGGTRTTDVKLRPLPIVPARETVTVTVGSTG
ncbi:MAG TPA: hypothetical protein VLJ76_10905 [Gaiellaceae bacterium]|nr:hypothetical protein [Gaiellaceae bacterium]